MIKDYVSNADRKYNINDLLDIMSLLRSENGCPWDKVQTHESIRPSLIEETYEAADAIDKGDMQALREELGDVLLQVVFHAQIEREKGTFDFDDVCDGICRKLILRHPHVFGSVKADTPDKVLDNWDKIKMKEKSQQTFTDTLTSVPDAFPALMRAQKLQKRAAAHGVQELDASGARAKLEEAAARLAGAEADGAEAALGETLFWAAALGRAQGADAEQALAQANAAFTREVAAHEG